MKYVTMIINACLLIISLILGGISGAQANDENTSLIRLHKSTGEDSKLIIQNNDRIEVIELDLGENIKIGSAEFDALVLDKISSLDIDMQDKVIELLEQLELDERLNGLTQKSRPKIRFNTSNFDLSALQNTSKVQHFIGDKKIIIKTLEDVDAVEEFAFATGLTDSIVSLINATKLDNEQLDVIQAALDAKR
ncbi:hypothetical protein ISG33_12440 [Glaciecola sp. MH2013]|uniref:hypothetical protein n=1 Tax=Glaciecola sp. MH2013 TaxID=2785524 RepID=UPI00189F5387|nr:hypothetical protein [Glaciecola sp. MH2013]MBF7074209.1 hypothetical protein [Glaciecola sp. MH2013]